MKLLATLRLLVESETSVSVQLGEERPDVLAQIITYGNHEGIVKKIFVFDPRPLLWNIFWYLPNWTFTESTKFGPILEKKVINSSMKKNQNLWKFSCTDVNETFYRSDIGSNAIGTHAFFELPEFCKCNYPAIYRNKLYLLLSSFYLYLRAAINSSFPIT